MPSYKISVDVQLKDAILDPKGKATQSALHDLGFNTVSGVRIGKHIILDVSAANESAALEIADHAAHKLLSNPVIEDFSLKILK
jgi:phosphoribosylformylglycinamidine synthase